MLSDPFLSFIFFRYPFLSQYINSPLFSLCFLPFHLFQLCFRLLCVCITLSTLLTPSASVLRFRLSLENHNLHLQHPYRHFSPHPLDPDVLVTPFVVPTPLTSTGFIPGTSSPYNNLLQLPLLAPRLSDPSLDSLVEQYGCVTTFPMDLALRWVFQNPDDGSTEVLYARDTELRWTEVLAGCRAGKVPPCYVPRVSDDGVIHEPMNREWFIDMYLQFQVSPQGTLLREGLEVCCDPTDFKWKAVVMLEQVHGELDFGLFTPERLVDAVRSTFRMWHLDSYNRASAILYHFNSVSPLSFPSSTPLGIDFSYRNLPPSLNPPPLYDSSTEPVVTSSAMDIEGGFIASTMDFEGEI